MKLVRNAIDCNNRLQRSFAAGERPCRSQERAMLRISILITAPPTLPAAAMSAAASSAEARKARRADAQAEWQMYAGRTLCLGSCRQTAGDELAQDRLHLFDSLPARFHVSNAVDFHTIGYSSA